jgi:hypothetical protein
MHKLILLVLTFFVSAGQLIHSQTAATKTKEVTANTKTSSRARQFTSTFDFIDATISSLNSFNSLIKKENYRTRITSFNNPASSDMGFSLENEVQAALKPLLLKAKNTNGEKFSQVVSSLLAPENGMPGLGTTLAAFSPVFPTLMGLVGTLTVQEKRITKHDLDSFISAISRYFVQYERLYQANIAFDQNIERLNSKLKDLQFDVKEYMLDMIVVLNPGVQRTSLKNLGTEELLLKYLDKYKLEEKLSNEKGPVVYPSDGIKGAKEISASLQKLFSEYQKVYGENYQQIRSILSDSKTLGKNINVKQVDASLKELEELYTESNASDVLSLRLTTLAERLKVLVATEQAVANKQ